jgi:flagellar biosynthetic protein FliR
VNTFLIAEAAAFALAMARVAGLVLVSPFPGRHVTQKTKIGFVLLLAFLARSNAAPVPLHIDAALLGMVPSELALGLVLGFTVRLSFSTAEILGASLAQSIGMTMGAVYDPTLGAEDPIAARVVTLLAMLLFLGLGAHRVALGYLLESFRAVPLGQVPDLLGSVGSFVSWTDQAMEAGVRLSMPIIAVGMTVQVALALVARASPSLQIFSIGMGVTVAAGLLATLSSLPDTTAGLGAEIGRVGPRLEQVLGATP